MTGGYFEPTAFGLPAGALVTFFCKCGSTCLSFQRLDRICGTTAGRISHIADNFSNTIHNFNGILKLTGLGTLGFLLEMT